MIIFHNWPYNTNWLNPAWRKAKMEEPIRENILYFETFYPECSDGQKARHAEMPLASYRYWRNKLNLEGGIK